MNRTAEGLHPLLDAHAFLDTLLGEAVTEINLPRSDVILSSFSRCNRGEGTTRLRTIQRWRPLAVNVITILLEIVMPK